MRVAAWKAELQKPFSDLCRYSEGDMASRAFGYTLFRPYDSIAVRAV